MPSVNEKANVDRQAWKNSGSRGSGASDPGLDSHLILDLLNEYL
jgi:hypothetical protein